uniref:Macaca fascicularis brain cDNA, clone: QtrA-17162 n=1 Tax=Macaca fascicularis TaxID=9541 RepID=I7GNQ2_MACFA|nr:unnamed protein product [Macaca fascicularis]
MSLNLLVNVSESLTFINMLSCPSADHNSAIAFGLKVSTLNSFHLPTMGLLICWALEWVGRDDVETLGCTEYLAQALGSQHFLRLTRHLLPLMLS